LPAASAANEGASARLGTARPSTAPEAEDSHDRKAAISVSSLLFSATAKLFAGRFRLVAVMFQNTTLRGILPAP
jgi:hypothetical protein